MTKIAIASDHAGYHLKGVLIAHLKAEGYVLNDFGLQHFRTAITQTDKWKFGESQWFSEWSLFLTL